MNVLGLLRQLGDRLGILEMASGQQSSLPVKIRTRSITLVELTTTIEIGDVQQLAEMPAELSVPFDEIFKTAGIQSLSPTGWNVEQLQQFLDSDPIRQMDRAEAQRETLRKLSSEKVDPAELIKDAVSRDQALDAFQEVIVRKRSQRRAILEQSLAELEAQQKRIRQEMAAEDATWHHWHDRKRQMERDMARTIGYLIDKPVISIDDE